MHPSTRTWLFPLALVTAFLTLSMAGSLVSAQTVPPDQLEQGARLYAENCAVCHGENGQGRVGATLAKDWPSIRPDLRVRATIANGIEGTPMVAWSQENGGPLTSDQIEALVAYILSWETGGGVNIPVLSTNTPRPPITPLPDFEGDPNNGAVLFAENCEVCHGPDGRGRIGADLAKAWASVRPDLEVRTTIARGVEGSPMPAWSQVNGGPLTEAQIDDLAAFVVSLPRSEEQIEPTPPSLSPFTPSWLSGWGGVLALVVLFVVVVSLALIVQTRQQE
jgi:mono/diheme cytochrome c family protein